MSKALIGMDKSGSFRVYVTVATDLVEQARQIHATTPVATAGLGRVLTAAGLMAIMLKKDNNKLTVNFKGDGPARQILATAYGDGRVKGYIADPNVDLPPTPDGKFDVGGSLGIGELTVIRDLGLKEPYTGTIALVSGEIAEDLAAYFFISEQQNTSVALGVKIAKDLSVEAAGGMIIQMMPGAQEGAVDALEKLIEGMDPITTVIERAAGTGETGAESGTAKAGAPLSEPGEAKAGAPLSETGLVRAVTETIFAGLPEEYAVEILEERDIRWECDCSRDRIEQALMTIGRKDMEEIIEEDGEAELQCHFCRKKYHFTGEELEGLLEQMK